MARGCGRRRALGLASHVFQCAPTLSDAPARTPVLVDCSGMRIRLWHCRSPWTCIAVGAGEATISQSVDFSRKNSISPLELDRRLAL